jgi:predicted RecB family nuclease
VYLDIEGLPGSESYYLIGALVVSGGREIFHSFWADRKSEEPTIFVQLIEAIRDLPDLQIFHYGKYWESSKAADTKFQLLQYNQDDCRTLKRIVEFLRHLSSPESGPSVSELRSRPPKPRI